MPNTEHTKHAYSLTALKSVYAANAETIDKHTDAFDGFGNHMERNDARIATAAARLESAEDSLLRLRSAAA